METQKLSVKKTLGVKNESSMHYPLATCRWAVFQQHLAAALTSTTYVEKSKGHWLLEGSIRDALKSSQHMLMALLQCERGGQWWQLLLCCHWGG